MTFYQKFIEGQLNIVSDEILIKDEALQDGSLDLSINNT
jgi:hypothetical protein